MTIACKLKSGNKHQSTMRHLPPFKIRPQSDSSAILERSGIPCIKQIKGVYNKDRGTQRQFSEKYLFGRRFDI